MGPDSIIPSTMEVLVKPHIHCARRLVSLDDSADNPTRRTNFLIIGEVVVDTVSTENMTTFQLLRLVHCVHTDHTVLIMAVSSSSRIFNCFLKEESDYWNFKIAHWQAILQCSCWSLLNGDFSYWTRKVLRETCLLQAYQFQQQRLVQNVTSLVIMC